MKSLSKLSLLLLLLSFAPYSSAALSPSGFLSTDIRDLVLIFQGGVHRMDFNVDQIRPYVVHQDRHGNRDWLFDGFLFVEFDSGRGVMFEKRGDAPYSSKSDWEWLIDRQFAPGKGIPALEDCIEEEIKLIGTPPFRHKVVIGIPEPPIDQTDWGELDGRPLDFRNDSDRVAACNWYIDLVKARFDSLNFKNIELSGFYWTSEKALGSAQVTVDVAAHLHSLDYLFYWIPYYGAIGYSEWRQYGFDAAYLQPTYFWNRHFSYSRLQRACELARTYGMGLEMEFDLAASVDSEKKLRDRAYDYMSSFRESGAHRDASLAYYEGGAGVYYFSKKTDPADRQFIDDMASFIQSRRSTSPRSVYTTTRQPFRYGTVTVKLRVEYLNPGSKITVALLPLNSVLGPLPSSGEIYLMKLSGANSHEIFVGTQTMQNNDTLKNARQSVVRIDDIFNHTLTLQCLWTARDILFHIDGCLVNVQEDLYDASKPYYPQGWPFNSDDFYLDISTEGDAGIRVESISITPF